MSILSLRNGTASSHKKIANHLFTNYGREGTGTQVVVDRKTRVGVLILHDRRPIGSAHRFSS